MAHGQSVWKFQRQLIRAYVYDVGYLEVAQEHARESDGVLSGSLYHAIDAHDFDRV